VAVAIGVFLILSVVAGVLLVRQRQNIQEKAQVLPLANTVTFPKAGTVRIYYTDFTKIGSSYGQMKMVFKSGSTEKTAILPGGPLVSPAKMEFLDTTIAVAAGDSFTVTQFYGAGNTQYASLGWIAPSGGKCGPAGHADVAAMIAWAAAQGETLVDQECWADSAYDQPPEYDYNDFFTILSYVPAAGTPSPSPSASPGGSASPNPSAPAATPNSCGGTCGSNFNCAAPLFCFEGYCRNTSCSEETDCTCSTTGTASPRASSTPRVTATPRATAGASSSGVQTTPRPIPETGVDWPTAAGVFVGIGAIVISILLAL